MDILTMIIENVDLMYIVTCNAATYFVIKLIEGLNKTKKQMSTGWKRLVSLIVAILIGGLTYHYFQHPLEPIFYGIFVQFVTWDYLFKPFVKSLGKMVTKDSLVED